MQTPPSPEEVLNEIAMNRAKELVREHDTPGNALLALINNLPRDLSRNQQELIAAILREMMDQ